MANEVREEAPGSWPTRNCELEARVTQPARDAVILQSEGLGQSEGAKGRSPGSLCQGETMRSLLANQSGGRNPS